ncbi:MAG: hypothetical protein RBT05_07740 [Bacteroidales bacterium]|jgi:hypothetical protein|nr:hypothetical protein [Bacteroidales bacterium]
MEKFRTDYVSKVKITRDGETSFYDLNILNKYSQSIFSTKFRIVPGESLVRVIEETEGVRFFHGEVPKNKAPEFVNSLAKRYVTACFLEMVGRGR